jgi:hypothetical protein
VIARDFRLAACGAVFLVVSGLAIRETLRSKVLDRKTRTNVVRLLCLTLILSIGRIIVYVALGLDVMAGWRLGS